MRPSRGNAILLAAAVGIVFLAGLIAHGVLGAVLLLVVAAVLMWLSTAAWRAGQRHGRWLRVMILVVIVVLAVVKLVADR